MVVTVGLTVIAAVVAPVLQRKDVPPDAVSVVDPPIQIEGLDGAMLHTGTGFTTIVAEQDDVHPLLASVTVTVYVVVTEGLTVMDAVVAPVLQRNESPPVAVSVTEPPGQIDGAAQTILHCGATMSWLTTTEAKQLSLVLSGLVITNV